MVASDQKNRRKRDTSYESGRLRRHSHSAGSCYKVIDMVSPPGRYLEKTLQRYGATWRVDSNGLVQSWSCIPGADDLFATFHAANFTLHLHSDIERRVIISPMYNEFR